jgi:5-bromo-4-chloroindolyl phosphate hydrolysis protein
LDTIQEDPTKLKPSQQFLNYYLDATVNILTKYVDLAGKDVRDAEIQKSLLKVETTLITIKDAFDKQLAKLLSNDAMNLDVEIQVLEQTINSEGLGKNQ